MSILSDSKLIDMILSEELLIDPFIFENIQPASIDMTLSAHIKKPKVGMHVDIAQDASQYFDDIEIQEKYDLAPGKMIIAHTRERIGIPRNCNGHIHNRSSLIRLGLNAGAGSYINPGYQGYLPLSLKNDGEFTISLVPGMRFCQLVLSEVEPDPIRDYSQRNDSKYFGECGNIASSLHRDKELAEFISQCECQDLQKYLDEKIKKNATDILSAIPDEMKRRLGMA